MKISISHIIKHNFPWLSKGTTTLIMNILLITEIYPSPTHGTVNETRICHYFATEWTKMGHEVRVVHFNFLLPWYYTIVGKVLRPFFKNNNWSVFFKNSYRHVEEYTLDGIPVVYVPIVRQHGKPTTQKAFNQAFDKAKMCLGNYKPEVIVGHWEGMASFICAFNQIFPNAKTGIVLHEKVTNGALSQYVSRIGSWGFRNKSIKESFEHFVCTDYHGFICNSGIPKDYLTHIHKLFPHGVRHFIFVGKLLELKRVENSIRAIHTVYKDDKFTFDIVGDGICANSLKQLTRELNITDKVKFHGWEPRDKVQQFVEAADCFIMVSDYEAFGLVYVEAMAKGCITIGTSGQGADGIIEDGVNGLLCPPKNLKELISVVRHVRMMTNEELSAMSDNARATAQRLTDEEVATDYLNHLIS